MKRRLLRAWMVASAAASVGWAAWAVSPAAAQYRVNDMPGHALDASNRIGSGGYNSNGPIYYVPSNSMSNSIYLGNSTGFSGFHGFVPSSQLQNPFAGNLPQQPSLQLLQQTGTSAPGAAPTYNQAAPFYTINNSSYAPPGFGQLQGGVYTPIVPDVRQPQDYRLGAATAVSSAPLPAPGTITGPGEVDPTANMTPSFLSAANQPMFGATAMNIQPAAQEAMVNEAGISQGSAPRLSTDDILRLRNELANSPTPWLNPSIPAANPTPGATPINSLPGANNIEPGVQPGQPPTAAQQQSAVPQPGAVPIIGATPAGSPSLAPPNLSASAAIASATPLDAGGFSTGQKTRTQLLGLPAPAQQSPQYAKLRALLQQYDAAHPKTDEEANRMFQAALKARRQYQQSLGHTPTSEPATSAPPRSQLPATYHAPMVPPPAPVQIGSIGQTFAAAGLSQLIMQGEDLARHQQFKDAIAKFLDARQVAPNNMLIMLDLANAELGAGFYAQAEQYLREAFSSDPATLMATYDVKSVIGEQRLQVVIGDLKQIASADPASSTPIFLLAYLSYNTGEKAKAMEYLKLAQTRSGGQDFLLESLGDHWSLPTTKPAQ